MLFDCTGQDFAADEMYGLDVDGEFALIDAQGGQFGGIDDAVANACAFAAGGAAGTVYVFIGFQRKIQVDDVGDVGNV